MIDAPLEFELTPRPDAPWLARRWLTQSLARTLADDVLATARLLVTELVTNAVTHGHGRITLRTQLSEHRLFVEVVDDGDGFEFAPRERDVESPVPGGWGLTIVDAESSRWGISRDSSCVWFELERPGPRLVEAARGHPG